MRAADRDSNSSVEVGKGEERIGKEREEGKMIMRIREGRQGKEGKEVKGSNS
jgi:hypothetical protein